VRIIYLPLIAALSAGCASFKKQTQIADPYDGVTIDQMLGNSVSSAVFQRTVVCLDPRRETRRMTLVTNVSVRLVTNTVVLTVTNQTLTAITNNSRTVSTNLVALPPLPSAAALSEAGVPETNQVLASSAPPNTTNETVTSANNVTLSKAGNQISVISALQMQLSRQVTLSASNVSLTTADSQLISVETNQVLTSQTNFTIVAVTNVSVAETNLALRDYYLVTEITPPPDFTLQSGESLVLLIDGVRHGFSPTTSTAAFVARKGYTSTLYRVPPEVLVDIANARQVRFRIRGVNSVIERAMNTPSRNAFKKFLVKYFQPGPAVLAPDVSNQAALPSQPES
jgi:hypothetical protein